MPEIDKDESGDQNQLSCTESQSVLGTQFVWNLQPALDDYVSVIREWGLMIDVSGVESQQCKTSDGQEWCMIALQSSSQIQRSIFGHQGRAGLPLLSVLGSLSPPGIQDISYHWMIYTSSVNGVCRIVTRCFTIDSITTAIKDYFQHTILLSIPKLLAETPSAL
jgi:hypothetical protein